MRPIGCGWTCVAICCRFDKVSLGSRWNMRRHAQQQGRYIHIHYFGTAVKNRYFFLGCQRDSDGSHDGSVRFYSQTAQNMTLNAPRSPKNHAHTPTHTQSRGIRDWPRLVEHQVCCPFGELASGSNKEWLSTHAKWHELPRLPCYYLRD